MPDARTARQIAEHMIRVAAQNVEAMPIRGATPRERKLLNEEDYDFLLDDVVGEIDNAVVTVTWPGDGSHVVTREALVDAISRIEIRRIKPEGGVILVAAETLADTILAVVAEDETP